MLIPQTPHRPRPARFRAAGIPPELHHPKPGEGTELTSSGQKNSGKTDFMTEIIPHPLVFWEQRSLKSLLGISARTNSRSDSGGRFPLWQGGICATLSTTQVCFCDIILQSAHKHHPADTSGEDGKSKLILSAIFYFPPQTDLLRDEKKKRVLMYFFPPQQK